MVSLVRSIISLASDFGLPANFEDWSGWLNLIEYPDLKQSCKDMMDKMANWLDQKNQNFREKNITKIWFYELIIPLWDEPMD